jgi:hypothetical protein
MILTRTINCSEVTLKPIIIFALIGFIIVAVIFVVSEVKTGYNELKKRERRKY